MIKFLKMKWRCFIRVLFIFSSDNLFLFVVLVNSSVASTNKILLSVLFFFRTNMQVAIDVPKNKSDGN